VKKTQTNLIIKTKKGLYCPQGDFYLDPVSRSKVETALISHGHADHLRAGHKHYICTEKSLPILNKRIDSPNKQPHNIKTFGYGEVFHLGEVKISFHPAGHILGSAQIRMEYNDEVWVYTGDFKRGADPTCEPFEVIPCDVLISEATFSLPVFRWPDFESEVESIYHWWQENKKENKPSVLGAYSLGKAQRIMKALRQFTQEEILVHGAVDEICQAYKKVGVDVGPYQRITKETKDFAGQLIISPPSAIRSSWSKKFKNKTTAFASGWMRVRGNRRRRGVERGFIISDHADWDSLVRTFRETGAKKIFLFHENTQAMQKHLTEQGFNISSTKELV
tara:strand:- start:4717 stop:5721 length:1005 start_codon:yes stop_codon:yes gene_type:complete